MSVHADPGGARAAVRRRGLRGSCSHNVVNPPGRHISWRSCRCCSSWRACRIARGRYRARRIDWKFLLGLELTDPEFDHSVLSEFRDRLVADRAPRRLLELVLERLHVRGEGRRELLTAHRLLSPARVRARPGAGIRSHNPDTQPSLDTRSRRMPHRAPNHWGNHAPHRDRTRHRPSAHHGRRQLLNGRRCRFQERADQDCRFHRSEAAREAGADLQPQARNRRRQGRRVDERLPATLEQCLRPLRRRHHGRCP
ncbi:transposase [Streptomyces sp. LBUM 1478]|nr:transposase [Streptomyces sp. LBUM 1478]